MKKNHVLIDLDGTLAATWRREDLIHLEGWDKFHEDCINDDPIHDVVELVEALWLAPNINVIGFTGRNKKYWPATMSWLMNHDIKLNAVLMRADDDFRPTPEVKIDLAAGYFGSVEKIAEYVLLVIDDQENVLEAFAALGITVLHCMPRRG